MIGERIKARRIELNMTQQELATKVGYTSRSAINKIEKDLRDINQSQIMRFANALETTPAYLIGWEDKPIPNKFPAPNITEDYITFPVIGEIAAGYDNIAVEDWSGETVDIPLSYLNGQSRDNFFVLRVKGQSMYPLYHNGDKVLILKQTTLNRSGEIGAILYDDEIATLKKVEYVKGEDWLQLIPINPEYAPERIEGKRLEHCRVIGVPRLLIREIN